MSLIKPLDPAANLQGTQRPKEHVYLPLGKFCLYVQCSKFFNIAAIRGKKNR